MRPGYLGNLDDFWFGDLEGQHFEILEARSASPLYTIRDRVRGKTAEEFKAFTRPPGWSTTNIMQDKTGDSYKRSPYLNQDSNEEWRHLVNNFIERSRVFKLVG